MERTNLNNRNSAGSVTKMWIHPVLLFVVSISLMAFSIAVLIFRQKSTIL